MPPGRRTWLSRLLHSSFLQRHFSVFAVNFPSSEAQMSIFSQILFGHLTQQPFSMLVQRSTAAVVQAAIMLHHKMVHSFLPTAIKFHYTFNLRDLSNIFQVMLIFFKFAIELLNES